MTERTAHPKRSGKENWMYSLAWKHVRWTPDDARSNVTMDINDTWVKIVSTRGPVTKGNG